LAKTKVLVVGLGEVGFPLFKLLRASGRFVVHGFDIDKTKMSEMGRKALPSEVNIMHVCLPCFSRDEFVNIVVGYTKRFKPKLVIINSTVLPGTTMELHKRCSGCLVGHSPIRGVHKSLKHMEWELKRWTKYIGGTNLEASVATQRHFERLGLKTKTLKGCIETELAKLFETTYRAWMIACFQEMHRISKSFGADFDNVVDFLEDTQRIRLDRPIMFPGFIDGHCLIPNTELLLKSYDSDFLHLILKSNEKRKKEIQDKNVLEETEKVRKRAKALFEEINLVTRGA